MLFAEMFSFESIVLASLPIKDKPIKDLTLYVYNGRTCVHSSAKSVSDQDWVAEKNQSGSETLLPCYYFYYTVENVQAIFSLLESRDNTKKIYDQKKFTKKKIAHSFNYSLNFRTGGPTILSVNRN